MKSYSRTIRFLFDLQKYGMKFGLDGIHHLLLVLGNPHHRFPSIHIAGTNGKGSTAAMLAAICSAAGYTTGLYTSPHLVDVTERIRINGIPIPNEALVEITAKLKNELQRQRATFFEATTAIAFSYFARQEVDLAIVETGLGGRLDSTNVLQPMVSLITNISLEHTEILGKTLRQIAREKAGIIKDHTPCVTGISDRLCLQILQEQCGKKQSNLTAVHEFDVQQRVCSVDRSVSTITTAERTYRNLELRLGGRFQIQNLKLVLATIEIMNKQGLFRISDRALRKGLKQVSARSGIQARCMVWSRRPLILLDVAHNAAAFRSLVGSLKEFQYSSIDLVLGILEDKDYRSMISEIAPLVRRAYVAAPRSNRARNAGDLKKTFQALNVPVRSYTSPIRAFASARKAAEKKNIIVVTGSHYLVGEILASLNKRT